jgi:glycosyltransferase involved in cell wall biosynthesis
MTGLLFRTGDAKDLAEKIRTILNDSALAKRLGVDGYRRTRELFDSTKISQYVLARYRLELGIQDIKS